MNPIREETQKDITFPQFPSIIAQEDSDDDDDDQGTMHIGYIVKKYLRQFASTSALIKPLECLIKMASFSLETKRLE